MAEEGPKCRTCGTTKNVLLDEWVNEDGSVKAQLCAECMMKRENDMFWIDCVCENCGNNCKLQRHVVNAINKMNEEGIDLCSGECVHQDCDGKGHLYCQLCQIRSVEGEAGIARLKERVMADMAQDSGVHAREISNWSCSDIILMSIIPVAVGVLLMAGMNVG